MANITDVKIVSDANKAPPKYSPVTQTHDTREDADLWKDSIFMRRVTRYLCVTYQESDQVVCDLAVCNSLQDAPEHFVPIETTADTQEKALKKKQLAVKMMPKASATSAINDIILLGKQKRAPAGYTTIGEFNSFTLCVKLGPVERGGATAVAAVQQIQVQPAGVPPPPPRPPPARHMSKLRDPLSGIPFEVSKRWGGGAAGQDLTAALGVSLSEVVIKTAGQIDSEYSYRFSLERQVCEQSLMDA